MNHRKPGDLILFRCPTEADLQKYPCNCDEPCPLGWECKNCRDFIATGEVMSATVIEEIHKWPGHRTFDTSGRLDKIRKRLGEITYCPFPVHVQYKALCDENIYVFEERFVDRSTGKIFDYENDDDQHDLRHLYCEWKVKRIWLDSETDRRQWQISPV